MKKLNQMTASDAVRTDFAKNLRQTTRQMLLEHIAAAVIKIEKEFCLQDGCDFRFPDEDHNITLDADCISATDFFYDVEVEDPVTDTTATENRTLGKITLDCSGGVYLYPRSDEGLNEELKTAEMDTDTLFRLSGFLDCSLALIKMDTEES